MSNAAAVLRDGTTRLHKDGVRIHHHSGIAGFAEYAAISKEALVCIDKDVPFEHAASLVAGW
jgi:alcohol dehydrogenase